MAKDYAAVTMATSYSGTNTAGTSYNMTKIRPPKGYNGPLPSKLNIDYGPYKPPERMDKPPHPPIATKPAIYKPRHNISEKDLQVYLLTTVYRYSYLL